MSLSNNKLFAYCVVFYDFDYDKVDLKQWFEWVIQWFDDHQILPVQMDVVAEDIKWKKAKSFTYGSKFLKERDFKNVECILVQSDSPKHLPDSINADVCASIRRNPFKKTDMTFYFNEALHPFRCEKLEPLICELAAIVNPRYGFCHQRLYEHGPQFYTWGTIMGLDGDIDPDEAKEEDKIACWNHQYYMPDGHYRTGHLREIYPLNILSSIHLQEKVGHQSLEDWIKSSPTHGNLKPLTQDLWSWWVPQENIAPITHALKDTGLLICA